MWRCVYLLLLAISLTGCLNNVPKWSREQWSEITTRKFTGTTVKELLAAGRHVLELDDKKDISGYRTTDANFVISRKYSMSYTEDWSNDYFVFDFTATRKNDGVTGDLIISSAGTGSVYTNTVIDPGFFSKPDYINRLPGNNNNPAVSSIWPYKEVYDLYFSRIEALLTNTTWQTCDEAILATPSLYDPLCLFADDDIPAGARLSEKGKAIAERREKAKASRSQNLP